MADTAYNNLCAPVSAITFISHFSFFNFQFGRYHRIHPSVVVLAPHGAESAEHLTEGLGTDVLHQAGIAAGEVLVDVGGAELQQKFSFSSLFSLETLFPSAKINLVKSVRNRIISMGKCLLFA